MPWKAFRLFVDSATNVEKNAGRNFNGATGVRDTFKLRKSRKRSAYFTFNNKGDICMKVEETNLQSKPPADRFNGKSPQTGNKWLGKIKSVCSLPLHLPAAQLQAQQVD